MMENAICDLITQHTIIERDGANYLDEFDRICEGSNGDPYLILITTPGIIIALWPKIRSLGYVMSSMDGVGDLCSYGRKKGDYERKYVVYGLRKKEKQGLITISDYEGPDTPTHNSRIDNGKLRLQSVNAEQLRAIGNLFDIGELGVFLKGGSGSEVKWPELTIMHQNYFDPAYFSEYMVGLRNHNREGRIHTIGNLIAELGNKSSVSSSAYIFEKSQGEKADIGDIFLPNFRPGKAELITASRNPSKGKEGLIIRLPVLTEKQLKSIVIFMRLPVFSLLNDLIYGQSIDAGMAQGLKVVYGYGDECDKLYRIMTGACSPEESQSTIYAFLQENYPRKDPYSELIALYTKLALKLKKESISAAISVYWREFRKCSKAEAYQSATVMMGSLLETVVMSWVADLMQITNIFEDKVDIKYSKEELDFFNRDMKKLDSRFSEYEVKRGNADIRVSLKTCSDLVTHHCGLDDEDRLVFYRGSNHIRDRRNQVHPRKMIKGKVIDRKEFDSLTCDFEKCCGFYVTWTRRGT